MLARLHGALGLCLAIALWATVSALLYLRFPKSQRSDDIWKIYLAARDGIVIAALIVIAADHAPYLGVGGTSRLDQHASHDAASRSALTP